MWLGEGGVTVVEIDLAVVGHEADLHLGGGQAGGAVHRQVPEDVLHVLTDQGHDALLDHGIRHVYGEQQPGGLGLLGVPGWAIW